MVFLLINPISISIFIYCGFWSGLNFYESKLVISARYIRVVDNECKFSVWYTEVSIIMYTILFIYVAHYLNNE